MPTTSTTEKSVLPTSTGRHTDEQRQDVASTYIMKGTVKETALATGVPAKTIYNWMKLDWWKRLLEEAKWEHQELIEARLSNIVNTTADALIDRIQHGDVVVDSKGNEKRVPVKAKELDAILDKHTKNLRLLRNQPTKIAIEAKFDPDKLARDFAEIAEKNRQRIVSEQ